MTSSSRRILVVDDDPQNLLAFSELLRSKGYDVLRATSGRAGLQLARNKLPDLVLLDVMLPDLSGLEVCRQIKADPKLMNVFVILCSGQASSPSSRVAGLESGADDYIAKAIDPEEFLARLRTALRLQDLQKELRLLPGRIIEAQEAERLRVARELHDGVNQILASAHLRLRRAEQHLVSLSPAGREILGRCDKLLVQALEENRRIAHNLRPGDLDDLGLAAACRNFCKEVQARAGLIVNCGVSGLEGRLPLAVELNVFRILQEALHNVEKHARARSVEVRLAIQPGKLELKIADNGRGFNQSRNQRSKKAGGIGFTNMRERALALGGAWQITTKPGKGTVVEVNVPLAEAPAAHRGQSSPSGSSVAEDPPAVP